MKKTSVQSMIDELKPKRQAPPAEDLNNQVLSEDPAERVRQLDWQAQQEEERLRES